jgi:hypothetical protein
MDIVEPKLNVNLRCMLAIALCSVQPHAVFMHSITIFKVLALVGPIHAIAVCFFFFFNDRGSRIVVSRMLLIAADIETRRTKTKIEEIADLSKKQNSQKEKI